MADSKITALDNLTTADPANDMIPIVDVSATPPASGNTKRISINNLLACSPSATLASATITGDLTVDTSTLKVDSTNNRVLVGTTSAYGRLTVGVGSGAQTSTITNAASSLYDIDYTSSGTINTRLSFVNANGITNAAIDRIGNPSLNDSGNIAFLTRSGSGSLTERYRIAADGVATWSEVGGVAGTAMTLNSTGLGVGISPSYKLNIGAQNPTGGNIAQFYNNATSSLNGAFAIITQFGVQDWFMGQPAGVSAFTIGTGTTSKSEFFRIDGGGNVGVGVTPSTWWSGFKAYESSNGVGLLAQTNVPFSHLVTNAYDGVPNWLYKVSSNFALRYAQDGTTGNHQWFTAASGTAGNAITWATRMTLDVNGNLILLSSNTPATLATNGQLTVNATSNTNLRFSYRGSDGTTRIANITLA
jgi:hypothetical protein